MKKKKYLSPAVEAYTMVPFTLLGGTSIDGNISEDPATQPAMGNTLNMDLSDMDFNEKAEDSSQKLWDE